MGQRFQILVIALYFIYIMTFLTGRPTLEITEQYVFSDFPGQDKEALYEPDVTEEIKDERENFATTIHWNPGLIQQAILIQSTLDMIKDPLLESDASPNTIMRDLERTYAQTTLQLWAIIIWGILLILFALTVIKKHWFAGRMNFFVMLPSMGVMLALLLSTRKYQFSMAGAEPIIFIKASIEVALFFLGLATLFGRALPRESGSIENEDRFMVHMSGQKSRIMDNIKGAFRVASHIVIIGLISLVLSNLLLLPVYKLQMKFPNIFAIILVLGIIGLSLFYIFSYIRVSRTQGEDVDFWSGFSFLGFRFVNNGLFLLGVTAIITLVLGAVILVAGSNVEFLQTIHLLNRPDRL